MRTIFYIMIATVLILAIFQFSAYRIFNCMNVERGAAAVHVLSAGHQLYIFKKCELPPVQEGSLPISTVVKERKGKH